MITPPGRPWMRYRDGVKCAVNGCDRLVRARGVCSTHYARHSRNPARYGPLPPATHGVKDPVPRFWAKVMKGPRCWLWSASRSRAGYGKFGAGGRFGLTSAHRFSWELHHGPIPPGMCICHRCDNPPCVRPDHLFLGTLADNNADMKAKGRGARGKRNGSQTCPERLVRGSRQPTAKLTEGAVEAMRLAHARGERQKVLADRFHVSRAAICNALQGKTWKHVPMPMTLGKQLPLIDH